MYSEHCTTSYSVQYTMFNTLPRRTTYTITSYSIYCTLYVMYAVRRTLTSALGITHGNVAVFTIALITSRKVMAYGGLKVTAM